MQVSADHTDSLDEVRAGQIVALHGLSSVKTGDTLITPKVWFAMISVKCSFNPVIHIVQCMILIITRMLLTLC